jgi:hypothetical protein
MWIKSETGDSSLASFDTEVFGGWGDYYDDPHTLGASFASHLDFWLTDCDTAVVELGGDRVISANLARGWKEVGYSVEAWAKGSKIRIYENEQQVAKGSVVTTVFSAVGSRSFIGSLLGSAYAFHGFVYSFRYAAMVLHPGVHKTLPDTARLIECGAHEYLS